MAKRKKTSASNNDMKVAAVVTGLFAAAVILFFILSKGNEPQGETHNEVRKDTHKEIHRVYHPVPQVFHHRENITPVTEPSDTYISDENTEPVETSPVTPHVKNISGEGGKIAFIIDDWGQSISNCKYLRDIPEPMAVSILPGLRHTKDVAACAKLYHKLTMLHLPLEAMYNSDYYPPNYIIKTSMDPALVSRIVEEDLDQLPTIEGVNNHMGSKATANRPLMRIIFRMIKQRGLFFVDSMTSHFTVTGELAREMGLTFGKRDVFLDNVNSREAIVKQLVALAQKARRRGYAVAIGHDRHLTMQVLKDEIPLLEKQGFEIVSIKELLKYR